MSGQVVLVMGAGRSAVCTAAAAGRCMQAGECDVAAVSCVGVMLNIARLGVTVGRAAGQPRSPAPWQTSALVIYPAALNTHKVRNGGQK